MTRKDYETIATIIDRHVDITSRSALDIITVEVLFDLARNLADSFEKDNEAFDRERFLAACGVR
jgi:hypothetical protein